MKQVVRYVCEVCNKEHPTPTMATECEASDRKFKALRETVAAEEKRWTDQGHEVWYEYSGMKHAPKVDAKKFGPHSYDEDGTSDCAHKCGCWMGPAASGGPVNPFGACPNNPKEVA